MLSFNQLEKFFIKESFEVGQIVKWKENLKNKKFPHKNQPAIVVAILDEPVINTDDESGSPYFLETLDIILGIVEVANSLKIQKFFLSPLSSIKYKAY